MGLTPAGRLRNPVWLYARYCTVLVAAQLLLLYTGTMAWDRWTHDVHDQSMRYQVQGTHALLAEHLLQRPLADRHAAMQALQPVFAYPLRLDTLATVQAGMADDQRAALAAGQIVMTGNGRFSHQRLGHSQQVVTLGDFDAMPNDLPDQDEEDLLYWASLLTILVTAFALPLYFLIHRLWHDVRVLHDTVHHLRANAFEHPVPVLRTRLLQPVGRALRDMSQQMRTLLDGQRLMSQAMAHELRTPIARLRFTASLLEEDHAGAPSPQVPLLQEMQTDLQWLEDLTAAGVEYVRFGRMPLVERSQVDMAGLLQRVATAFLHQSGPHLQLRCLPGVTVHGNTAALELAMRNLLGNALRHARSRVRASALRQRAGLLLLVEDDGPGIAPVHRADVFAPYFRLHDAPGGFGLGLAMVRAIVERHGGTVDIGDSPLGGAALRVWLPHG